jgi:Ca2+-binding EF-hand superfamily protein
VISRKNLRDGSYAIDYDDGESELRVAADLIRKKGGLGRDDSFGDSEMDTPVDFRPGDKVEARYKGGTKWYPGVISRKNLRGGTYAIEYDDGESELRVAADLIRKKGGRALSPSRGMNRDPFDSETEAEDVSFREGDKVEAKFGGGDDYFPGVISRKNRDGSYAIDYDDGDNESRVAAKLIRKKGGGRSASPKKRDPFDSETEGEGPMFSRGDKVEARHRGRWLPARVTKANRDGTYDVRFDGGDEQPGLHPREVRARGGAKPDPFDSETEADVTTFREGDKVEAKFGGGAEYFPGVISRKNRDGSYAIDYDDGDNESRVAAKLIRKKGGRPLTPSRGMNRDPFDSETEAEDVSFGEGDKVEAKFGGGDDYFPGVISRKNRDGSYAIDYDDGDNESRVAAKLIRKKGGRSASPKKRDPFDSETEAEDVSFREGDKVEAKFGGGDDYFPGVISRKNRDGSYAIDYDDGDNESRVAAKLIRKKGGRASASRRDISNFVRGDKVLANYRDKWRKGKVLKSHRDGTYDIRFDVGKDVEGIEARDVKRADGDDDPVEDSGERDRRGTASHVISEKTRKVLRDMFRKYQEKSVDASARSCFVSYDAYNSGLISKRDFRSGLREVYAVAHPSGRVPFEEWMEVTEMKALTSAMLVPEGRNARHGDRDTRQSRSPARESNSMIRYDAFLGYATDSIEEPAMADLHRSLQDAAFKKSKYSSQNIIGLFEKVDAKKKGFIRFTEFIRIVRKFYRALSGREEKLLQSKLDASSEGIVDYYGFVWWLKIGRPEYADEVSSTWFSSYL